MKLQTGSMLGLVLQAHLTGKLIFLFLLLVSAAALTAALFVAIVCYTRRKKGGSGYDDQHFAQLCVQALAQAPADKALAAESAVADATSQLEQIVHFLMALAEIAPLAGLLGTVGGLISAFAALGSTKVASLSALAPGIAEALVTTFAGLLATLIALIGYHTATLFLRRYQDHLGSYAQLLLQRLAP
jgi:biopolymer transport protein ExbB/TolQ